MSDQVICPVCSQSDQVDKVSTLYIEGIGEKRLPFAKGAAAKEAGTARWRATMLSPAELTHLSRKLAPPSSGKASLTRPVHPDLVVIAFSLILPVFLYNILSQQRAMLLPVLLILAGFYGLYFFKRQAVVARFERQQAARRAEQRRIERGIQTWMRLYYCARDSGVFLADRRELIPIDQMTWYLLRQY
jgi:hypothetical protein